MLKKIMFFFRMPFAGILLVVLTLAMAIATFVESSQGTNSAWALIYGTWWFELLFLLTGINLVGNIVIFKLYKKSKITVFTFHMAFILIILGAGVTRFLSQEGMMHIREGDVANTMMGNDTYIDVNIKSGSGEISDSKEIRLSVITPTKFRWRKNLNGLPIKIKSVGYIRNAITQYVPSPGGKPYMQLVLLSGQQYTIGVASGEELSYPGISISLDNPDSKADLKVSSTGSGLIAYSHFPVKVSSMGGGSQVISYNPGDTVHLEEGKLVTVGVAKVVLQQYVPSAKKQYTESENQDQGSGMDVVKLEVNVAGMKSDLYLPGRGNISGEPASVKMGDLEISCTYGSHKLTIPFMIKLREFEIERYPGSNSPSSFASEVTLIDNEHSIEEDQRIYMNNVLKHRGYRFYQSSYDQDERGTVLSVNRDSVGTRITYIGYFFLMLGMLLALFARKTRFARLARSSSGTKVKAVVIFALMLLGGSSLFAQGYLAPSKEQANEFGQLWVQGKEGRFKPMNTLSNEIVRKVTGKAHMDGLNTDQILMGIILYPYEWNAAPLFEVENAEIHMLLGFKGAKVCFNDFLPEGKYLLSEFVNNAYNKQVPERTEFDKEVMKLDERVNIFYMIQNGGMLSIFPDVKSENNNWLSISEMLEHSNTASDTLVQVFRAYTDAIKTGDESLASEIITFIGNYQIKNCDILPKESKKSAEIYYNKLRLFNKLAPFYGLFGFILIIVQFLRIFRPGRWATWMFKIGIIHLAVAFGLHTLALLLRWYIGGHAPLSNGYESMIFVSWISLLAGLIFVRKSGFAISLTAILSALSLLVAHLSWMNPDITNLVPVLKSPWLTIHVTVIMAGYGFLGLSALAGLINLVFYSIQNKSNRLKISPVIDQITAVNHMSVIVGLYFLTAGVFLGGVWANESWGRYWGWDPKETWALISVLVYAFIAHMHQFPGLKGGYAFNLGSLLGFSAILMTYFGVNYFLGGMHSYAGGTTLEIPWYTILIILSILALSVFAYRKQKQFRHDYLDEIKES